MNYFLYLTKKIQKQRILKMHDRLIEVIKKGEDLSVNLSHDEYSDSPDDQGWTPLFHAVKNNRLDLIKYFLSCGADRSVADHNGLTVYDIAGRDDQLKDIFTFLFNYETEEEIIRRLNRWVQLDEEVD